MNVGKGGTWLLPFLCSQYGLQPQEAMIIGDRLDTDIALGRQGGLRAVLPLTGGACRVACCAAAYASMLRSSILVMGSSAAC